MPRSLPTAQHRWNCGVTAVTSMPTLTPQAPPHQPQALGPLLLHIWPWAHPGGERRVRLCFLNVAEIKGPCRLDKLFLLLLGTIPSKGFVSAHRFRAHWLGRPRGQEHEGAIHTASAVRKQSVAQGMLLPTFRWVSPPQPNLENPSGTR